MIQYLIISCQRVLYSWEKKVTIIDGLNLNLQVNEHSLHDIKCYSIKSQFTKPCWHKKLCEIKFCINTFCGIVYVLHRRYKKCLRKSRQ